MLFIWSVAPVVNPSGRCARGGLSIRLAATSVLFNILEITQFLDKDKWSSISQLIKGKSRDLQKLLKYFNGTATSVSNVLLLVGVLSISSVLYSKDLLVVVQPTVTSNFISSVIQFIFVIIP